MNPVGSFDLTDGTGDVRGLGYYVDPTMDPVVGIMGVSDAAVNMLGPVGTLTADVPKLLGRDVAVYRFAAGGVVDPRGLVKLTMGAPVGTARGASKG
jgi:hypothetical protein